MLFHTTLMLRTSILLKLLVKLCDFVPILKHLLLLIISILCLLNNFFLLLWLLGKYSFNKKHPYGVAKAWFTLPSSSYLRITWLMSYPICKFTLKSYWGSVHPFFNIKSQRDIPIGWITFLFMYLCYTEVMTLDLEELSSYVY